MTASTKVRRVLVTGGNRGIGLEVCRQLALLGHNVFLGSRDMQRGVEAALEVGATAIHLDIADPASAARVVTEIGGVDILINNAATHYDAGETALTADWAVVREAFETNLFGAWRTAKAFVPRMRKRGWGRIVNVSSEAGSITNMNGGTPA